MSLVLHDLLLWTLRSLFPKKPQFLYLIFNSRILSGNNNPPVFFWNLGGRLPRDILKIMTRLLGSASKLFPDAARPPLGWGGQRHVVEATLWGQTGPIGSDCPGHHAGCVLTPSQGSAGMDVMQWHSQSLAPTREWLCQKPYLWSGARCSLAVSWPS